MTGRERQELREKINVAKRQRLTRRGVVVDAVKRRRCDGVALRTWDGVPKPCNNWAIDDTGFCRVHQ